MQLVCGHVNNNNKCHCKHKSLGFSSAYCHPVITAHNCLSSHCVICVAAFGTFSSLNNSMGTNLQTTVAGSYICNADTTFKLNNDASLELWSLQYAAFQTNISQFSKDGKYTICSMQPSKTISHSSAKRSQ
ncbi:hypothetical protein DPMN_130835 [Dreissena polymorpha]|uniref:Uncharacterized protein n=1 Tax=Dreissena polymorpha TaxID=45954 RepID=A0A9D4H8C8_DREPO|nr:hypothetical protein DPMN_130835 [Dreissena polymorpha]